MLFAWRSLNRFLLSLRQNNATWSSSDSLKRWRCLFFLCNFIGPGDFSTRLVKPRRVGDKKKKKKFVAFVFFFVFCFCIFCLFLIWLNHQDLHTEGMALVNEEVCHKCVRVCVCMYSLRQFLHLNVYVHDHKTFNLHKVNSLLKCYTSAFCFINGICDQTHLKQHLFVMFINKIYV